jgi:hypothetical protein
MTQLLDFHTEFTYKCRNICAMFGTTDLLYSEELHVPLLLTASNARLYANNLKSITYVYIYIFIRL